MAQMYIPNELLLRIQKIHQFVRIHFLGGSENSDFKYLGYSLQEFSELWPCAHIYLEARSSGVMFSDKTTVISGIL